MFGKWLSDLFCKLFNVPLDPVHHCDLYKEQGCAHVDGMLCDMNTCSELKDYRTAKEQANNEIQNGLLSNDLSNGLKLLQINPNFAVDLTGGPLHGMLYIGHEDGYWTSYRRLSPEEIMQAEDQVQQGIVTGSEIV